MPLSDSLAVLEEAASSLNEINQIYAESVHQREIPSRLRTKIKTFLENNKSALDYAGFYIFSTFCTKHIKPNELESKQKNVYFPITNGPTHYERYINSIYPGLLADRPDIVQTIEKYQPFTDRSQWLKHLNNLVNNNKHRNLTKQERKETTHIGYMEDVFGNRFINCTFEGVGTPIQYGNSAINFLDPRPNPFIKTFKGSIKIDYVFKDINRSVLSTLHEIYDGTESIIKELESILRP